MALSRTEVTRLNQRLANLCRVLALIDPDNLSRALVVAEIARIEAALEHG